MASLNILGIGDEEPGNLLSLSPPLSDGTPRGVQQIPERDALARLYNNVTSMIERPAAPGLLRPSWNPNNPVGTERVREEYLTNPDLDVVPGVKWGESWVSPQNAAGLNRAQAIGEGFAGSASPGKGLLGIKAYHGSPHSFDRFDTSRIGTGEGAQAYGHGLYFAEREGVAKGYRDALTADKITIDGRPASAIAGEKYRLGINETPTDIHNIADYISSYGPFARNVIEKRAPELLKPYDAMIAGGQIKQAKGHMYEVQVNANPEHMLHWDKPLSEQHPVVQAALGYKSKPTWEEQTAVLDRLKAEGVPPEQIYQHPDVKALEARMDAAGETHWGQLPADATGADAYKLLSEALAKQRPEPAYGWNTAPGGASWRDVATDQIAAAQKLREAGIPGIRYLDQGSRGAGEGSHNLVVFDDATIEILRKYGLAGLMLGGGAAAGAQGSKTQ